jgi:hypothetical protein
MSNRRTKTYLIDREELDNFIMGLQEELRKLRHYDVNCILS